MPNNHPNCSAQVPDHRYKLLPSALTWRWTSIPTATGGFESMHLAYFEKLRRTGNHWATENPKQQIYFHGWKRGDTIQRNISTLKCSVAHKPSRLLSIILNELRERNNTCIFSMNSYVLGCSTALPNSFHASIFRH